MPFRHKETEEAAGAPTVAKARRKGLPRRTWKAAGEELRQRLPKAPHAAGQELQQPLPAAAVQ